MRKGIVILMLAMLVLTIDVARPQDNALEYKSPFMRVELARDQPAIVALAVDSLGKNKLNLNALRPPGKREEVYEVHQVASKYEYRPSGDSSRHRRVGLSSFLTDKFTLRSHFAGGIPPPPLVLNFNSYLNHATLLGHSNKDGSVVLPALLNLPDHGTFRITSSPSEGLVLGYDALRHSESPSPNSPRLHRKATM